MRRPCGRVRRHQRKAGVLGTQRRGLCGWEKRPIMETAQARETEGLLTTMGCGAWPYTPRALNMISFLCQASLWQCMSCCQRVRDTEAPKGYIARWTCLRPRVGETGLAPGPTLSCLQSCSNLLRHFCEQPCGPTALRLRLRPARHPPSRPLCEQPINLSVQVPLPSQGG